MSKIEEQIGPSLGHFVKPEGRGFQLLERAFILDRYLLESGDVVPALISQELGCRRGGDYHDVGYCPLGL